MYSKNKTVIKKIEQLRNDVNKKADDYHKAQLYTIEDDEKAKETIKNIEKQLNAEVQKANNENIVQAEKNNIYIKTFLLFVFKAFFNKASYPQYVYLIFSVLISLCISILFEAIILIAQRIITMPNEDIFHITEIDTQLQDELKPQIKIIFNFILGTLISFSIFLIYGMIKEAELNKFNIIVALISSMIPIIFSFVIPDDQKQQSSPFKENKTSGKIANTVYNFANTEGKNMLIKGLLSFVAFFILGIFYDKSIQNLTVPAVGVALGSVVNTILGIDPRKYSL